MKWRTNGTKHHITNNNNESSQTPNNRMREIEHTRSQHFGGLFNRCFPIDARVGCQPPEKNIFNFRQKSVFYALICCSHKISVLSISFGVLLVFFTLSLFVCNFLVQLIFRFYLNHFFFLNIIFIHLIFHQTDFVN